MSEFNSEPAENAVDEVDVVDASEEVFAGDDDHDFIDVLTQTADVDDSDDLDDEDEDDEFADDEGETYFDEDEDEESSDDDVVESEQAVVENLEPTVVMSSLPVTGEPRVDDAIARLSDLSSMPVDEHVAVFEDVQRRLHDTLADLSGQ